MTNSTVSRAISAPGRGSRTRDPRRVVASRLVTALPELTAGKSSAAIWRAHIGSAAGNKAGVPASMSQARKDVRASSRYSRRPRRLLNSGHLQVGGSNLMNDLAGSPSTLGALGIAAISFLDRSDAIYRLNARSSRHQFSQSNLVSDDQTGHLNAQIQDQNLINPGASHSVRLGHSGSTTTTPAPRRSIRWTRRRMRPRPRR